MNKLGSKVITGAKYIYLTIFFVLLAGFFHPVITGNSFDLVIVGTLTLSLGLAGAILVYKATTSNKRTGVYLGVGFGLIALSLMAILLLTERL